MAAFGAASTARVAGIQAKSGLIPLTFVPRAERRSTGAVTALRTTGVGRPVITWTAIRTGSLVDDAVRAALVSVDGLDRHAREVADAFRRERLDEARRGLADLVERTQTLLRVAARTAQATGSSLETICDRAGDDTRDVIAQLIDRQFRGDWGALSGTLRDDYTAVLAKWRRVFEVIGERPDDDPRGFAA